MVIAAMAVAVGVRADSCTMLVAKRNLVVPAPHHARGEIASLPHDSAVNTVS